MVSEVMVSQAVLICNPQSQHQDLIALILKRIEGYITATQYMMISYNVTRPDLPKALAVRVCLICSGEGGGSSCLSLCAHRSTHFFYVHRYCTARRSRRGSGRRRSARWRRTTGWPSRHWCVGVCL